MALLERVATLIRANLNELVDRAENPEKMIKQVILDMQNQFMQVKTQVAIALADLHLLEKKQQENQAREEEWMRKAELAVSKGDDRLARAGLDRAMSYKQLAANFVEQMEDQKTQVEVLKDALNALARKISEVEGQADVLIAQHRRTQGGRTGGGRQPESNFDRSGWSLPADEQQGDARRGRDAGNGGVERGGDRAKVREDRARAGDRAHAAGAETAQEPDGVGRAERDKTGARVECRDCRELTSICWPAIAPGLVMAPCDAEATSAVYFA